MKIGFYVKNKDNPVVSKAVDAINSQMFAANTLAASLGVKAGLKEEYLSEYSSFVDLTMDDKILAEPASVIIDAIRTAEEGLSEKFGIPMDSILIKIQ